MTLLRGRRVKTSYDGWFELQDDEMIVVVEEIASVSQTDNTVETFRKNRTTDRPVTDLAICVIHLRTGQKFPFGLPYAAVVAAMESVCIEPTSVAA